MDYNIILQGILGIAIGCTLIVLFHYIRYKSSIRNLHKKYADAYISAFVKYLINLKHGMKYDDNSLAILKVRKDVQSYLDIMRMDSSDIIMKLNHDKLKFVSNQLTVHVTDHQDLLNSLITRLSNWEEEQ